MNILALDTSSMVATVAVINEEKILGEYTINTPMTHSQKLMPVIDELLKNLSLTMKDIQVIAVSRGPGSFTGVRIGIATVKGLAFPMNIPILGVSSLEGLAYNLPYCQGLLCPIMDARRSQVYTAVYKWENYSLKNLLDECPLTIEELMEFLSKSNEKVIFLGDGVNRYKAQIMEHLRDRALFAPQYVSMQRASSIAQAALDKIKEERAEFRTHFNIIPTYLRKSEAERQYEEKMKRCNEDNE